MLNEQVSEDCKSSCCTYLLLKTSMQKEKGLRDMGNSVVIAGLGVESREEGAGKGGIRVLNGDKGIQ